MLRKYVLPWLIWIVYATWSRTWRMEIIESPEMREAINTGKNLVFAFWHGDELVITSLARFYKVSTLTSTSRDGELLDRIVKKFGVRTARGSSTRGGISALKGVIDHARDGYTPSVAVDGPKGPYHQVKPGVFQIAKLLDAQIVPVSYVAQHSYVFKKSWNLAQLPMPFAKIVVVWESPLPKISENEDPRSPTLAINLAERLNAAGQRARKLMDTSESTMLA